MTPQPRGRLSRPATRLLLAATVVLALPTTALAVEYTRDQESTPPSSSSPEQHDNLPVTSQEQKDTDPLAEHEEATDQQGTAPSAPPAADSGEKSPAAQHATGLDDPAKKDIAMQIVASAENSSLDWKAQYGYIEDIGDGRGYTAGIIGFCSGTGDMLDLVREYTEHKPDNPLARYLPALEQVNGSDSHEGLDPGFTEAWQAAAQDPAFQQAQNDERDRVYFNPSVSQAKSDGLGTLGQFIYYDAMVMHGESGFVSIREQAVGTADTPAEGGDETAYLHAFLDARVAEMKKEAAHEDTSRVDTAQRVWLDEGNLGLDTPLVWSVYGDEFRID